MEDQVDLALGHGPVGGEGRLGVVGAADDAQPQPLGGPGGERAGAADGGLLTAGLEAVPVGGGRLEPADVDDDRAVVVGAGGGDVGGDHVDQLGVAGDGPAGGGGPAGDGSTAAPPGRSVRRRPRHDGTRARLGSAAAPGTIRPAPAWPGSGSLRHSGEDLADHVGVGDLPLGGGGQVLELPAAPGQLVGARDDGQAEALPLGVGELRAQLAGVGIDLDADACGPQPRRQGQVVAQRGGVELGRPAPAPWWRWLPAGPAPPWRRAGGRGRARRRRRAGPGWCTGWPGCRSDRRSRPLPMRGRSSRNVS